MRRPSKGSHGCVEKNRQQGSKFFGGVRLIERERERHAERCWWLQENNVQKYSHHHLESCEVVHYPTQDVFRALQHDHSYWSRIAAVESKRCRFMCSYGAGSIDQEHGIGYYCTTMQAPMFSPCSLALIRPAGTQNRPNLSPGCLLRTKVLF